MLAESMSTVSMGPWIGVISQIIGWGAFIIVLAMMKNFFAYGLSISIAEFLIKIGAMDEEKCRKIARWFSNSDQILECLEEIRDKLKKADDGK